MLEANRSSSSCLNISNYVQSRNLHFGLNACQTIIVLVLRCRFLHTYQAHAFTTFDLHIHHSFASFPLAEHIQQSNIPQLQCDKHKAHQTLPTLSQLTTICLHSTIVLPRSTCLFNHFIWIISWYIGFPLSITTCLENASKSDGIWAKSHLLRICLKHFIVSMLSILRDQLILGDQIFGQD